MSSDSPESFPDQAKAKYERIAVSEKIIADISTGIYRTPAAAVKELVANAYDADATSVQILTDCPRFRQLVIKDDGHGMSIKRFLDVIHHIGGSWKRIVNDDGLSPHFKRPLIGRIGIGLLAVAQLGQRFFVSSSVKGVPTRFLAEVDLQPFHKDDAALKRLGTTDNEPVEIGHIRYVDGLPERKDAHFTVVTVPDPKSGLLSEMRSQLREALGAESVFSVKHRASKFTSIVSEVQKSKRADIVLDGYHYFAWELGLLAPVGYLKGGPFESSGRTIAGLDETLPLWEPEDFSVTIDSLRVRRPIRFPNPGAVHYGGPDPKVFPIHFDKQVAGRTLRCRGYVYAQQPHIDPTELQGVQVRIRGVGIGGFDRTWLGYPWEEGHKFGQISGELFVDEGLESALNIDRASFRETDPHYLALRAWLWTVLRKEIFPDFKVRQDSYRASKRKRGETVRGRKLAKVLQSAPEAVSGRVILEQHEKPNEKKTAKSGAYQNLVVVKDGDVSVDRRTFKAAIGEMGLNAPAAERLKQVSAVLAAYGIWDQLKPDEAETLLQALAVAVSQ